jgi:hypothetical protein
MICTMARGTRIATVISEPRGWEDTGKAAIGPAIGGHLVSDEPQPESATPAKRLAQRLEDFYASLPEDEKAIMRRIMRLAAEPEDVQGYAAGDADATKGGGSKGAAEPHPIDEFRVNLGIYLGPEQ